MLEPSLTPGLHVTCSTPGCIEDWSACHQGLQQGEASCWSAINNLRHLHALDVITVVDHAVAKKLDSCQL